MNDWQIIEPPAEWRNAAMCMYQMFAAYVQAGFTEDQAIDLLKSSIKHS